MPKATKTKKKVKPEKRWAIAFRGRRGFNKFYGDAQVRGWPDCMFMTKKKAREYMAASPGHWNKNWEIVRVLITVED